MLLLWYLSAPQQFCLRLVELINSIKERTGSRIANDVAAFAEADGPRAAAQSGHQAGLRGRAAAQSGQQAAPRRPLPLASFAAPSQFSDI